MPFLICNARQVRALSLALLLLSVFLPQGLMAEDIQLEFTKVSDLTGIVDITNAGDGSDRIFLVEQAGRIFILKNGQTLAEPFLDIRNLVTSSGEQGLLSLAFAPDYRFSGYFYIWYSHNDGPMVLSRIKASGDPDIANRDSEEKILVVEQPFTNHNGGRLQFGPDGMLYLGLGDGGGSNDPQKLAQDGSTLLGKIIRIDVDPANDTYVIPPDNPFVGDAGFKDEIWALGLRNPWKMSFDSKTGDLYIADVGQGVLEEVNFQLAGSFGGENYGWSIMEGSRCATNNCDQSGLIQPVTEYTHTDGCAITGGEVYRGNAYPNLSGTYLFGDYCSGKIWGLDRIGPNWGSTLLADTDFSITTFGMAEDRNLYLASESNGIYQISDGTVKPEFLQMNVGFSDAWFDPSTSGQGFYISVLSDRGLVTLAWFTYDTERPPEDVTANLGEPGHRWLTALGSFTGNQAIMDIEFASGGIFNASTVIERTDPPGSDGTITLTFDSCHSGTVEYDIPSINGQGTVRIQRVVSNNNIALCEELKAD
jgi:glucose/arabinose dehydrogenase